MCFLKCQRIPKEKLSLPLDIKMQYSRLLLQMFEELTFIVKGKSGTLQISTLFQWFVISSSLKPIPQ